MCAALALALWGQTAVCFGQIKPLYDRCVLELDGQSLKPMFTRHNAPPLNWLGDRAIAVQEDTVAELDPKTGHVAWSVKSPDGLHLFWWAADAQTAYLEAYAPRDSKLLVDTAKGPELRRLDLATHKWLPTLAIPAEKAHIEKRDHVMAVLIAPARLVVLTEESEGVGYNLANFVAGQDKPVWSKHFKSAGARPDPGVYLLSAARPDYADSALQHLSWLGDSLLVCAGEKEDLVCLEPGGKEKWHIARIWEYQRGFIGPSVWSHYISRFGTDRFVDESVDEEVATTAPASASAPAPSDPAAVARQERDASRRKELAEARAAFNKQFQCAIIGGPLVVAPSDPKEQNGPSIFVAVAKGPNDWNHGYLAECVVYEIDARLGVVAMTTLPRMVHGRQFGVNSGAALWACQKGGMARLKACGQQPGQGPGSPDLLCDVEWYRQISAATPAKTWLTADPADDVTAFGETHAYRTIGGGYVVDKARREYSFPIAIIDTKTGLDRTATLRVPFQGDLPLPTSNFESDADRVSVRGAYVLGLTRLRVHGQLLEIVVGMEDGAEAIMFDAPLKPN
jgi:hypothetical protein